MNKNAKYIMPNGETLREYCAKNGINLATIYQRMRNKAMTIDEAINFKAGPKMADGTSLMSHCKDYNEYFQIYRFGKYHKLSWDEAYKLHKEKKQHA